MEMAANIYRKVFANLSGDHLRVDPAMQVEAEHVVATPSEVSYAEYSFHLEAFSCAVVVEVAYIGDEKPLVLAGFLDVEYPRNEHVISRVFPRSCRDEYW
jgi:hypothetical protein